MRPTHQAHPDRPVPRRAQPVDDVDRLDPAPRAGERGPFERGPAEPQVPDDPPRLVPRDEAQRRVGARPGVAAAGVEVLPPQHLGRGEVRVRRGAEAGDQETPQLVDVLGGQRADLGGHAFISRDNACPARAPRDERTSVTQSRPGPRIPARFALRRFPIGGIVGGQSRSRMGIGRSQQQGGCHGADHPPHPDVRRDGGKAPALGRAPPTAAQARGRGQAGARSK